MKPEFFRLDSKISYGRSPVKIQAELEFDTLAPIPETSELIHKNYFKVVKGKKWFDILPFNNSTHFAISERVKNIIDENNLTGLRTFPISIKEYNDKNYFGLIITSTAGEILNLDKLNRLEEENINFDITTWDGSDFFTLKKTLILACNQKAYDLLTKHKLTNIEIEKL